MGFFNKDKWKDKSYHVTLFKLRFGGVKKENHMTVPSWLLRLVGKKMVDGQLEKVGVSKAKLTAVVYIVIQAIQVLGPAFGHPVSIPPEVFRVLEAIGLWSVRDAIKG